jgi:hypothetical protein
VIDVVYVRGVSFSSRTNGSKVIEKLGEVATVVAQRVFAYVALVFQVVEELG